MKRGFTLIEILVVATIIGLLTAVATVSYSSLTRQSRDATRKSDLEQIRAALEMYKSNNDAYPTAADLVIDCSTDHTLTDASGTMYLSKIPTDPQCASTHPNYIYTLNADNTYTLTATLEMPAGNYQVGPYGEIQTATPIPTPTTP